MAVYTDDGNRADSTSLGASWTALVGAWGIITNGFYTSATGENYSVIAGSVGNDQYIEALYLGTTNLYGVGVRMQSGYTGYNLYIGVNGVGWELQRALSGSFTTIASGSDTFTAGVDRFALRIVGTTLTVYKGVTSVGSVVDSNIASGKPGLISYSYGVDTYPGLDDVEAGDVGGGSSPAITDVDTDENVYDGQTSVAVTGTNMGAANANRTFALTQGAVSINQTETGSGNATSATLTLATNPGGAGAVGIKCGTAALKCTLTSGGANGSLPVTVSMPSGQLYVDIATPNPASQYRITASPDIASGDQVQARGFGGGAAPAGLSLASDGTYSFGGGNAPAAFEVRVWDASDSTFGAWQTQFVSTPLTGKGTTHGLNAWMRH